MRIERGDAVQNAHGEPRHADTTHKPQRGEPERGQCKTRGENRMVRSGVSATRLTSSSVVVPYTGCAGSRRSTTPRIAENIDSGADDERMTRFAGGNPFVIQLGGCSRGTYT
jgi:hypothetical protein